MTSALISASRIRGAFQPFSKPSITRNAEQIRPKTYAVRWSYIGRDSRWNDLDVTSVGAESVTNPVLDSQQFAALVDDSRVDEMLVLLGDRGCEVGKHPSANHVCASAAILVAVSARLADGEVLDWCEWYWRHAKACGDCSVNATVQTWQNTYLMEK